MGNRQLAMIVVLLGSHAASADDDAFPDYAFNEPMVAAPGIDTAKIADKPAWCDAAGKITDVWDGGRISRTVDDKYGIKGTIEGALHICENTTQPTWRKYAERILQKWMNWTGETQADAEKSLRARIQFDRWTAEQKALCKALEVSPEVAAEVKTFADARRDLFGCNNEGQTLWQDSGQMNYPGVGYYLDSDLSTDELMRVYWLFGYARDSGDKELPSKSADDNLPLLYYAVAQTDFAKIDRGALDKQLQAAPYNNYARVVLTETLAVLEYRHKKFEAALDKLAKGDEDYTAILRTAPKKAWGDWDSAVAKWRPELEHSEAFEKLWAAPSRKAMKGCSTGLLKDAEKVVKQFKNVSYKDLVDKLLADPVANLLFARLAVCTAFDKVQGVSGPFQELVTKGRGLRGPRSLAYYAIVDAYASAAKDRPRMVLSLSNFSASGSVLSGSINFDPKEFDYHGFLASEHADQVVSGVVGSTKKTDEGTQIKFKKVSFKYQNYTCEDDVHHPLRIDEAGRIVYYQRCKNLPGMTTVDRTPDPVMISSQLDGVAKPGVFISVEELGADRAKTGEWMAVPVLTKKASTDKAITSFYGLPL